MVMGGDVKTGDMKVLSFYFSSPDIGERVGAASVFLVPAAGVEYTAGWFFTFPSNVEAILWRASSAVLTAITSSFYFARVVSGNALINATVFAITITIYVPSRLLFLVEAFISVRHLTPGMLAIVKWTSSIPHI
jgi:hypothetical protein